jgi:hypothetical protein
VLEVRIIDVVPRPSGNPQFKGRTFGSNAAANWGFHYGDTLTEPRKREVVTIYEVDATGERRWARAVYNYRWTPQTDPFGVVHPTIDYPGVPVDHRTISKNENVLRNIRVPVRRISAPSAWRRPRWRWPAPFRPPHGRQHRQLAHRQGGDHVFPRGRAGANFTVGDPHASQGDSELCGTAIECSLTGTQLILHKKADLPGTPLAELAYPLLETQDEWLLHGFSYANYLAELGPDAQTDLQEVFPWTWLCATPITRCATSS